ncbi:MAG TPA: hypothetical protein VJO35_01765 [Terriglobales bacterium]|nr:hypothetical protein [Terriglobales bacterium]
MTLQIWRYFQIVTMTIGMVSVFLASPISLVFAWTGWIRTDRQSTNDLRKRALQFALILVSFAGACFLLAYGWRSLTRGQSSVHETALLNWICIIGALGCLVGLVLAALAKGRARVPAACAGFFGLLLFLQFTPLAYLP